jgi:hypothetical protein
VRRTDPAHRSLGRFFHEEIATPLGFEFYLGLPDAIPDERLAPLEPPSLWKRLTGTPPRLTLAAMNPRSVLSDLAVEVGPARGVRVADVADGGEVQGVVQSVVAALGEPVHDLATRGAFHGCGAVVGGELVAVGEAAGVDGEPDQVTGNDRADGVRSAAIATDRASLGSFLSERPVPSTRIRDANVAGTSTTFSPASSSCCAYR